MNTVVGALLLGAVAFLSEYLLKSFFPEKPKLNHLITACFVLIILVGLLVWNERMQKQPSQTEEIVAEQVRACMQQHGLEKAHSRLEDPSSGMIRFMRCDWPPPAYADTDGYSEINVNTELGPEDATMGEAGYSTVDRIKAPCQTLNLSYTFGKMGTIEYLPTYKVAAGSIVEVNEGEAWKGHPRELNFLPDRGEIVVLRNLSYRLDDATCDP